MRSLGSIRSDLAARQVYSFYTTATPPEQAPPAPEQTPSSSSRSSSDTAHCPARASAPQTRGRPPQPPVSAAGLWPPWTCTLGQFSNDTPQTLGRETYHHQPHLSARYSTQSPESTARRQTLRATDPARTRPTRRSMPRAWTRPTSQSKPNFPGTRPTRPTGPSRPLCAASRRRRCTRSRARCSYARAAARRSCPGWRRRRRSPCLRPWCTAGPGRRSGAWR